MVDYIVLNLSKPIVYEEGKSLRIVVRSINPENKGTSNYKTVTFEKADISSGTWCYGAQNDYDRTLSVSHSSRDLAAIHLGLLVEEKTLSGIVTSEASGEPIANATVTIYNEEKDVQYSGTTDEEGKYNIKVVQDELTYTVTVEADGYVTLNGGEKTFGEGSVVQNYVLSPITGLVLDDNDSGAPEEQYAATVTYDRKLYSGVNTLVLPFQTTTEEINATYVLRYTGTTEEDGVFCFNFEEVSDLEANVPYVVIIDADDISLPIFENKEVTPSDNLTVEDENGNYDFVGTYTCWTKNENSPIVHGDYIAGEKAFKKAKGGNGLKAYRAYLKRNGEYDPANVSFNFNGEVITGIEAVELLDRMSGEYYNLNGQRVGTPQHGIYIKNGKKIVVK